MTAPQIDDAFVVAPPTGARIRTRLKVSEQESDMLWQIGTFLGGLYRQDLADRFAIGDVPVKDQERARRKRGLTKQSSSRWAGSITRAANDHNLSSRPPDAAEPNPQEPERVQRITCGFSEGSPFGT